LSAAESVILYSVVVSVLFVSFDADWKWKNHFTRNWRCNGMMTLFALSQRKVNNARTADQIFMKFYIGYFAKIC
jgi:hypothetical protein